MKTRIVYLTFFLLISLTWLLQAQYVLYKVPLPSGYAAEVRGYPGSTADGQTVTGSYNATDQLFHFQITISGPYRLYYNSGGGSPTTLDALWSGSYGRYLLGYDDMDLAIRLAGNSSGGQLLTAGLATGSVTSDKLGTASVTSSKLGTGSVTSTAVLDGSLTYQDMADLTINNAKLGPNSIDSTKVQPRQIDSSELEDGAVINRTIASGAVNSASIENASISGVDIANDAIDTQHIATSAVGTNEISAISNADIPAGTVAIAVNGVQDSVRIVAGTNVTVTTAGDSIEIASTGGGGSGDITAVTASRRISGGGISGDVSVSVDMFAADTADLKGATGQAGDMYVLEKLSGSNSMGGGIFVMKSSGSFSPDGATVFSSGTAGLVWIRNDIYNGGHVYASYAGVIADGSTDDLPALEKAETVARALKRVLELPGGNIRIAGDWVISNTSQDIGIIIKGQGPQLTTIKPDSGYGIVVGSGSPRTRNVKLLDFAIIGNHTAKTDTAIYLNTVGNCRIENIRIGNSGAESFRWAIYGYRTEQTTFFDVDALYNKNGAMLITNSNGNAFFSCNIGQADSVCMRFSGGSSGNTVQGGEFGNANIAFKVDDISQVSIEGCNVETVDSTALLIIGDSDVQISQFVLSNGASVFGWFGVLNSGRLTIDSYKILQYARTDGYFKRGSTDFIIINAARRETLNGASPLYATNKESPEFKYPIRDYNVYPENTGAIGTSNYDENRGLIWSKLRRETVTGSDQFNWIGKTDSGYVSYNLTAGTRHYYSTTGSGGSELGGEIKRYSGYKILTTSTGDSTEVTITTESGGVRDFISIGSPLVYRNGGGLFRLDAVNVKSFNVNNGSLVYTIYHPDAGDKSRSIRLYYNIWVRD